MDKHELAQVRGIQERLVKLEVENAALKSILADTINVLEKVEARVAQVEAWTQPKDDIPF